MAGRAPQAPHFAAPQQQHFSQQPHAQARANFMTQGRGEFHPPMHGGNEHIVNTTVINRTTIVEEEVVRRRPPVVFGPPPFVVYAAPVPVAAFALNIGAGRPAVPPPPPPPDAYQAPPPPSTAQQYPPSNPPPADQGPNPADANMAPVPDQPAAAAPPIPPARPAPAEPAPPPPQQAAPCVDTPAPRQTSYDEKVLVMQLEMQQMHDQGMKLENGHVLHSVNARLRGIDANVGTRDHTDTKIAMEQLLGHASSHPTDKDFEAIHRIYQQQEGLNVTSKLDANTLKLVQAEKKNLAAQVGKIHVSDNINLETITPEAVPGQHSQTNGGPKSARDEITDIQAKGKDLGITGGTSGQLLPATFVPAKPASSTEKTLV